MLDIENAYIIISLTSLAVIVLVLDYMKTRIGLKPENYSKQDKIVLD